MDQLIEQLLTLAHRGVRVYLLDGKLKVQAEKGALNADDKGFLQANKQQIAQLLQQLNITDNQSMERLSSSQQRLWTIDRIEGGSSQYNMPNALELTGELDVDKLAAALNAVVERHQVLSSVYTQVEETALQLLPNAAERKQPLILSQIDLSDVEDQQTQLAQLTLEESQAVFDLTQDLMLRAKLLKLAADRHVLLLTLHHIAGDGWSMSVLVDEVCRHYIGESLAPLSIQYADYAHWQQQWLAGEQLDKARDYWGAQLQHLPSIHQLPLDNPRPPTQSHQGMVLTQALSPQLTERLLSLANQHDATLFMLLNAAFACFIGRMSGQKDIVIGTPVANRQQSELEPLIGFFVNTLVLRTDLTNNPSFIELLEQSKQRLLGAYEYQQMPFEQLVDMLKPERDLQYHPLFQVMLVLDNQPTGEVNLPGLTIAGVEQQQALSKFELTLTAQQQDDQLLLAWEYVTALFDQSTIERWMVHFETLLTSIVTAPQTAIAQLSLMSDAQQQQVLLEWNNTDEALDFSLTVGERLTRQANLTPEATALVFEGATMSYRALENASNQLAHQLRQNGVKTGDIVGLAVDRSFDLVIGIYGILKAGGAYLPLKLDLPSDRLQFMLDDAAVSVVVCQRNIKLDALFDQYICIDVADSEQVVAAPQLSDLTLDNLAYVVYTSGSTGKPKGVLCRHRGLINRVEWGQKQYPLSAEDKLLQKSPHNFDVSVWELVWPLLNGATMVLAKPNGHTDPEYLADLIIAEQVTVLHFVPSMLAAMLASGQWQRCSSAGQVKRVFCSGETLPASVAKDFFAIDETIELHNTYGPTETAIEISFWPCSPDDTHQVLPIGQPISNSRIYVLDEYKQPVPVGVTGELHMAGPAVAQGYLNRPELNAKSFIDLKLPLLESQFIYCSGDMGFWNAKGELEFTGRIDHQVKLNGLRIELGEIEAALVKLPQVEHAAVLVHQQNLVAYFSGKFYSDDEVKQHLAEFLPDYMVPKLLVYLPQMPLNANGKTDRKALPQPQMSGQSDLVLPRNEVEQQLVDIWQQLLGLEAVSVEDNFFVLGGDSILSIQLVSAAKSLA